MDQKPWRWRRKGSQKAIVANGRVSLSLERNIEEDQAKELESLKCPSNLSDTFASLICDCNAKDELIRKHRRIAEQALAGQEMERTEAAYLKQELDKALQQEAAAEKKLAHLNAALKDCMREIQSLKEQQDERIQDAFSKGKVDFEKEQKKLETKLAENNRRISNLSAENANLMKALICKERLLKDLDKGKADLETELAILTGRLDSVEEENALLKYEHRVMEKELEMRNEERIYSRRSALENVKQINTLEAECQQLRHLVRKRLQADVQGTNQPSMARKRLHPKVGISPEKPGKGTNSLVERVYNLEEENTTLREILALSDSELHSWRIKYGQLSMRLAELEAQLQELSGGNSMQLAISGFNPSNYNGIGDSEAWANALLAELEQFRQGNIKNQPEFKAIGIGEMTDDVEMEKFAIVTTGIAVQSSEYELQPTSTELVPISEKDDESIRQQTSWLDEILKVILEEHRVSKRNLGELLQDIKIALGQSGNSLSKPKDESSSDIGGLLTWESSNSTYTENPTLQGISSNHILMDNKEAHEIKDGSFTRQKIRKHFGFDRSKSENQLDVGSPNRHNTLAQMIAIQSTMQDENKLVKGKLQKVIEENVALNNQIQESKQAIGSLQEEIESLKESKGLIEDQVENQRLINEDLNTQLTVAKAKLNENLHKLSSLEVELDDKNNCCEELQATCLDLQLQLETLSRKGSPDTDLDQVQKELYDEALCPMTAIIVQKALASQKKSLAVQRSSLRDHMLAKEDNQTGLKVLSTEETVSNRDLEEQCINYSHYKALPAPEPNLQSPEVGSLAVVPSRRPGGGFGFIRKLFLRRKKTCTKVKAVPLQRNTSVLMKQRDLLVLV